jgi:hypothetical protein
MDIPVTPEFVATTVVLVQALDDDVLYKITEYGEVPPDHETVIVLDCPMSMASGEAATVMPVRAALTVMVEADEVAEDPCESVTVRVMEYEPAAEEVTVHVELVVVQPEEAVTPEGRIQV